MRPFLRPFFSIAAASCAISCSTQSPLGNGTFSYECVASTGAACPSGAQPIPASIPLGTRFKISYTPSGPSAFSNVTVLPVSTDFLGVQDGTWVALLPGDPALYATSGSGTSQVALDYAFLHVASPATTTAGQ